MTNVGAMVVAASLDGGGDNPQGDNPQDDQKEEEEIIEIVEEKIEIPPEMQLPIADILGSNEDVGTFMDKDPWLLRPFSIWSMDLGLRGPFGQ